MSTKINQGFLQETTLHYTMWYLDLFAVDFCQSLTILAILAIFIILTIQAIMAILTIFGNFDNFDSISQF